MPKNNKSSRSVIKSLADLQLVRPKSATNTGTVLAPVVDEIKPVVAPPSEVESIIASINEAVGTKSAPVEAVVEPEAPKPVREKPKGGYRIKGSFVSAEAWNAWMDEQEAAQTFDGAADDLEEAGFDVDDGGPYNEDDSNEGEAHSEDEEADMEAAETVSEETHAIGDVSDEVIEDERTTLLATLYQYVSTCGYSQDMLNRAKKLDLPALRDYVESTRVNSGGSLTVAELLAETEEAYAEFVSSPDVQRKAGLIEAKGRDFINMAQKMERVFGKDVVLNAVQHQEYHELLKTIVQHSSVVDRAISSIADILRIEIPERLLLGGETLPVVAGVQLNTKTVIYILTLLENNLRTWASNAAIADDLAKKARAEADAFAKLAGERQKLLNATQDEVREARQRHEKATSKVLGYAIMSDEGDYLCIDDEDKPRSLSNMAHTEDWQEAIIMGTHSKALDLAARASDRYEIDYMVTPIVALGNY